VTSEGGATRKSEIIVKRAGEAGEASGAGEAKQ